jgi:thiol-disulfide isomerase/thioredoxin
MIYEQRLCCLLLLVVLMPACGQKPPADVLREGQLFPPLHLTGLDRADLDIDDLRGRWVVLNVWATWCGPCRKELAGLQRLDQAFADHELVVLGLNIDNDQHIAREFLRDENITFANYSDNELFIAQQLLRVRVYPDTFVIAPNGTLWRSISGERDWSSANIKEALRQAVDGHPEALQRL